MQGKLILGMIALVASPAAAIAGEPAKRPVCQKAEQPQSAQQRAQQRLREQECRAARVIPPIVDPTPLFLL